MMHDLELVASRVGIMSGGKLIRVAVAGEWSGDDRTLEQYVMAQIQAAKEAERGA
jgi:hypothetical protein